MKRKLLVAALLLVAVLAGAVAYSYSTFRARALAELAAGSEIAETRLGPVEYGRVGGGEVVVLFVHGTPGGYDQAFEQEGAQMIAPSRPGYLRTPISVGRTPSEQADAYAALLDALSIEKVVVMGASGGGPSAMAFAAAFPHRTQGLIAVEAVSNSDLPELEIPAFLNTDFTAWSVLSLLSRTVGAEGLVEMFVPDPENQLLMLENDEKIARFEELVWSTWPPSLRAQGVANDAEQFSALDLPLDEIHVPTLIIHGTADTNVPIAHAQALAERVPQAQMHLIENADHMMPFSHREEVQRAIAVFLKELRDEAFVTAEPSSL